MESILWFLIIGALFFFMMRHGCGAHMGGHGGHGRHETDREEPSASRQTVKDPVCGMEIDKEQAYSMVRRNNRQIFFCSEQCLDKFDAEPDKYE